MTVDRKKSKGVRALRLLGWIAVQIVVVVLLLEVALRIARPLHSGLNTLLYIPTVRTEFTHIERTEDLLGLTTFGFAPGKETAGFVLNSRGFRTPEYAYERGAGLRVVALGDSFTYAAVPHSQSWPVQLESALLEHIPQGEEAEVISLGVPGVGPQFYLRMWELEGQRLRPDIVVLGFFVGNDLVEEGGLGLRSEQYDVLLRNSLVVRALRNSFLLIRSGGMQSTERWQTTPGEPPTSGGQTGVEIDAWTRAFDPTRPTFDHATFVRIETERLAICLHRHRELLADRLLKVQPVIAELDRAVRATGAELVVLLIPDEFQVDDALLETLLANLDLSDDDFVRTAPQDALRVFFAEQGIRFIDVLPEFRTRAEAAPLYLLKDTHWNAAGNRLAAELVAAYLVQERMISTEKAAAGALP